MDDFEGVCNNIFANADELVLEVGEVQLRDLFLLSKQFGFRMKQSIKSHRKSALIGQRVLVHMVKS